ncbi:hypothetical protein ABBQ32_009149 [Trebouxia sp. C0010 RCD-2024]
MDSDGEEEELAQLRAQRSQRTGVADLRGLQQKQRQANTTAASFFEEPDSRPTSRPRRSAVDIDEDDEDAPAVVDDVDLDTDDIADVQHGALRAAFPMAFGQQESKVESLESIHAARLRSGSEAGTSTPQVGQPQSPAAPTAKSQSASDSDSQDETAFGNGGLGEPNTETDPYLLPVSHEVALEGQGKVVTSLDVDHSGSRLLAGSRDYSLRMFDFNGMKSDMRSFRRLEPSDGHPVHSVSLSPTGDAFLVATGSSQIKVYDRDGKERGVSVAGDMYIRDLRNTKGHISPCTHAQWHPTDRFTGMTSSDDGSIRVWDTWNVLQKTVIKPQLAKPGRIAVTACAYNHDGGLIGGGMFDGTLQIWDVKGKFGTAASTGVVMPPKPQMIAKQDWRYVSGGGRVLRNAHEPSTEITSLAFASNGHSLVSRGADETLKMWDLRKLKAPVHVFTGLPTTHSETGCCFSPDESLILTGVSAQRDGTGGALLFFDVNKLQLVRRIGTVGSAVAVHWHSRLNQIFVGTGDKAGGCVRALYDPTLSERGVLLCAARKPRTKDPLDFEAPVVIHTPHALPMFKEAKQIRKRKSERDHDDAVKFHKPEVGSSAATLGRGAAGLIGKTGGTLLTQYILKNHGMLKNPAEEDIRAAILRHEAHADEFKAHTAAYNKTQPNKIFAEEEKEEQEEGS